MRPSDYSILTEAGDTTRFVVAEELVREWRGLVTGTYNRIVGIINDLTVRGRALPSAHSTILYAASGKMPSLPTPTRSEKLR